MEHLGFGVKKRGKIGKVKFPRLGMIKVVWIINNPQPFKIRIKKASNWIFQTRKYYGSLEIKTPIKLSS